MFFRLPFRGMWRPPSRGYKSVAELRADGQKASQAIAKELSGSDEIKRLWATGDEATILERCKQRAFVAGDMAYVTPTMIFSSLKGLLRSQ